VANRKAEKDINQLHLEGVEEMDFSNLGKYATPEVLTVLGALAAAVIGYKVCGKCFNTLSGLAQKTGILGLAAAILFVTGVGGAGLGAGELLCRVTNGPSTPAKKGLSDNDLAKLAEKCHDRDMAILLLDYAKARDGQDENEDVRILTALVTKQLDNKATLSKEDREANSKTLTAFMTYLKDRRTKRPEVPVAYRDTFTCSDDGTFTGLTDRGEQTVAKAEVKEYVNKDSLFSIPISLCIMGLGVASSIAGVVCFRLKKQGSTT
jgi:hypothetical protein